jgi:hypothetical protein
METIAEVSQGVVLSHKRRCHRYKDVEVRLPVVFPTNVLSYDAELLFEIEKGLSG